MAFKGIDIRQSGDRLIFRASLKDSNGAKVTTGNAGLKIYELQSDATLKSYDFNDNTFKTTAATTGSGQLTHRQALNNTHDTGIWTANLTTLTGFTRGNIYFMEVYHASAFPTSQEREFQFGEGEGDFTVNTAGETSQNMGQLVGSIGNASGTVGHAMRAAIAQGFGQWSIVGDKLNIKSPDGSVTLRVFTLDDTSAPTSRT